MYYIFELFNRFKYTILAYFFLFGSIYIKYDIFFATFDYVFKKIFNQQNQQTINYYIYTHPFELYYTQIYFCFFTSLYFILPYIIWQLLDYKKTSLYTYEYNYLIYKFYKGIFLFTFLIIILYNKVIPLFLKILYLSKQIYISSIFSVYFELKVQDFIQFILYFNTLFTISIIFLMFISFLVFNTNLLVILKQKRWLYLCTIIFSTFISPPDIFSQLILILLLSVSIEFIIFIRLYFYNINLR